MTMYKRDFMKTKLPRIRSDIRELTQAHRQGQAIRFVCNDASLPGVLLWIILGFWSIALCGGMSFAIYRMILPEMGLSVSPAVYFTGCALVWLLLALLIRSSARKLRFAQELRLQGSRLTILPKKGEPEAVSLTNARVFLKRNKRNRKDSIDTPGFTLTVTDASGSHRFRVDQGQEEEAFFAFVVVLDCCRTGADPARFSDQELYDMFITPSFTPLLK